MVKVDKNNRLIKILLIMAGVSLPIIFLVYSQFSISKFAIKKFEEKRDAAFIMDLFKRDWYWLLENPIFSPKFFLEHMSPTQDPQDFGKENIYIGFENNVPVGFVTFYRVNFYTGKLHFLAVDENHRGKGVGEKLMKFAIEQIKKMGVTQIRLDTRINNKRAQKIYERLGFKEFNRGNGFINYLLKV